MVISLDKKGSFARKQSSAIINHYRIVMKRRKSDSRRKSSGHFRLVTIKFVSYPHTADRCPSSTVKPEELSPHKNLGRFARTTGKL